MQNQTFKSGFGHLIKFGAQEGLYASTFFEPEYLLKNPEVAAAVKAGDFKTGGEHYRKFGQFEPSRLQPLWVLKAVTLWLDLV